VPTAVRGSSGRGLHLFKSVGQPAGMQGAARR